MKFLSKCLLAALILVFVIMCAGNIYMTTQAADNFVKWFVESPIEALITSFITIFFLVFVIITPKTSGTDLGNDPDNPGPLGGGNF